MTAPQPPDSTLPRTTRGLRNRNPGNLRDAGIKWDGLTGADPQGFAIFRTDQHGIRALVKDLRKDYWTDKQRTVTALISEFCSGERKPHQKLYRFCGPVPWR